MTIPTCHQATMTKIQKSALRLLIVHHHADDEDDEIDAEGYEVGVVGSHGVLGPGWYSAAPRATMRRARSASMIRVQPKGKV